MLKIDRWEFLTGEFYVLISSLDTDCFLMSHQKEGVSSLAGCWPHYQFADHV